MPRLKDILYARDIKSTLGQISLRAISIASYKVKIYIFKYKKILVSLYIIKRFRRHRRVKNREGEGAGGGGGRRPNYSKSP